jgi:hypothetical protein
MLQGSTFPDLKYRFTICKMYKIGFKLKLSKLRLDNLMASMLLLFESNTALTQLSQVKFITKEHIARKFEDNIRSCNSITFLIISSIVGIGLCSSSIEGQVNFRELSIADLINEELILGALIYPLVYILFKILESWYSSQHKEYNIQFYQSQKLQSL